MRVLLDEHLNWRLSRHFDDDFRVDTIDHLGWKGTKNGELLELMSAEGIEVLITTDWGTPHQQSLSKHAVAVVVLRATSNHIRDTAPLVESGLEKIRRASPGEVTYLP